MLLLKVGLLTLIKMDSLIFLATLCLPYYLEVVMTSRMACLAAVVMNS